MPELAVDIIRSVTLMLLLLTGMAYMTLFERRVISRLQVRLGPNRTGPFGLLQPLADALKLFFKKNITPATADRLLYPIAPALALVAALASFAVIPLGPPLVVGGTQIATQIVELPVSVLYLIGASSLGVYGLVFGGWASGSKYSLLGGLRAAAQVVSYELILGLAVVGVVMISGSLALGSIVEAQARSVWFIVLQPLGFILYFVGAVAEVNRAPFDLPEAETELVAGYHTEYSGMRFAMYYIAEYVNMITVSAVAATLFLGGWLGPFVPGPHWLLLKMLAFLFLFVWLRATLPRLRYDQLMGLSWSVLLPLALLNVVLTALAVAAFG
jgi:NADH-quinone oxidoreductase subunit H